MNSLQLYTLLCTDMCVIFYSCTLQIYYVHMLSVKYLYHGP